MRLRGGSDEAEELTVEEAKLKRKIDREQVVVGTHYHFSQLFCKVSESTLTNGNLSFSTCFAIFLYVLQDPS